MARKNKKVGEAEEGHEGKEEHHKTHHAHHVHKAGEGEHHAAHHPHHAAHHEHKGIEHEHYTAHSYPHHATEHPASGKHREHEEHLKHASPEKLQISIIENLVQLQKINTSLAEKFDSLSTQITALLGLFEVAAKSFTSNPAYNASDKDKEFLEKIDRVLEQNKVLAKGLTLMEERMREKLYGQGYGGPGFKPQIREISDHESEEETSPSLTKRKDEGEPYEPSINRPLPKF